jgi:hypothetical protein
MFTRDANENEYANITPIAALNKNQIENSDSNTKLESKIDSKINPIKT